MQILQKYFSDLTNRQIKQFGALEGLYRHWNSKITVISRKDIDQLYLNHVLHSLSIAKVIQFTKGSNILDVGTGGGFPGIPLAILFPEVSFVLLDSIGKKIKVVDEVSNAIGLENIRTVHARVESVNEKFDFVVSRAVTNMKDFKNWVESLNLDTNYDLIENDPRLVIPFFDKDYNMIAAQGRSLRGKSKLRYVTIKVKENSPKIFGMNTWDENKTTYIVEGPIDSLFVENSLAMAGADLSAYRKMFENIDVVFVYDNEKRNKEIVKKMDRIIANNQKIVIWPRHVIQKDINDMILNNVDVMNIIEHNTYQGLTAKTKLLEFKL